MNNSELNIFDGNISNTSINHTDNVSSIHLNILLK